ncbi:MAG: phosphoribosylanthranilate isomerase [bacterium]
MVEIKICGITNISDALIAAECGADAVGFIFYPQSQRYVAPAKAKEIIQKLPCEISKVGVFVNHEIEEVKEIVQFCGLDLIQLHGDEPPEYCAQFPMSSLIKAVSCRTRKEIQELKNYPAGAVLMDGRDPGHFGGTGKISDWRLAIRVKETHPLILAGGLNKENIRKAIETVKPQAVDINSGVEISPGKKDPRKVTEIIRMVRAINQIITGTTERPGEHKDVLSEVSIFHTSGK